MVCDVTIFSCALIHALTVRLPCANRALTVRLPCVYRALTVRLPCFIMALADHLRSSKAIPYLAHHTPIFSYMNRQLAIPADYNL